LNNDFPCMLDDLQMDPCSPPTRMCHTSTNDSTWLQELGSCLQICICIYI